MIFSLEQKQEDKWINVGYAEFDSLEIAMDEAKEIAELYKISWDDMRIQVVDNIPKNDLITCDCCGHPLQFTNKEYKVYCKGCDKHFDREYIF